MKTPLLQTGDSTISSGAIQLTSLQGSQFYKVNLTHCPPGYMVQIFLACDVNSQCWPREAGKCTAPLEPLPPSFECRDRLSVAPYTVVCDYREDCVDGSDEDFCQHVPCPAGKQFYCDNGQVGLFRIVTAKSKAFKDSKVTTGKRGWGGEEK